MLDGVGPDVGINLIALEKPYRVLDPPLPQERLHGVSMDLRPRDGGVPERHLGEAVPEVQEPWMGQVAHDRADLDGRRCGQRAQRQIPGRRIAERNREHGSGQ